MKDLERRRRIVRIYDRLSDSGRDKIILWDSRWVDSGCSVDTDNSSGERDEDKEMVCESVEGREKSLETKKKKMKQTELTKFMEK